jgi:hypothetical protein
MVSLIRILLRSDRVRRWVIRRALRKPYWHLHGYMNRYWFFNEGWWIPFLPAIRVHAIFRRDGDREIHDHPFDFRTFILFGDYTEEDVAGNARIVDQGDTYGSPAERFHIITAVRTVDLLPGGIAPAVWTFVIMSRKHQSWGFLSIVNGEIRKVHHDMYESNNFRDDKE